MIVQLGYDLDRVIELRRRSHEACDELVRLGAGATDPEAAGVAAGLHGLHDVITAHWLPLLDLVVRTDPLGAAERVPWWRTASAAGLVHALGAIDLTAPSTGRGHVDVDALADDPGFVALARLVAARAGDDADFADQLVELLPSNPYIGLVAAVADLPVGLAVELAAAALSSTSHVDDRSTRLDAAAVEALLRTIAAEPGAVLDLLDADMVHELLTWPFLDPALVGQVLLTGLAAPAQEPGRLGDAHDVLRHLVVSTNDPFVDRTTLAPEIAVALAAGTAIHFPSFVTSLEPGDPVNLKDADGKNLGEPLGEYEEVLDYLGALLRDPDAATTLVAALQPLAAAAASGAGPSGPTDLADVGDLALALANAAANERLEDRMHAAAIRSLVEHVTVAVGVVTGVGAATLKFGPAARSLLSQLVRRSGDRLAAAADGAGAIGTEGVIDAAAAGEVMIEIGVYEAFVDDPSRFVGDGGLDAGALAAARASLERVRALAADGSSLADLERALQDVHVDIVRAGGGALLGALDLGSVEALDLHDPSATDLTRPLD